MLLPGLFLLWILLSGEVTVKVCLTGAVVSCLLFLLCVRALHYRLRYETQVWRRLWGYARYVGYLIVEMLKAGFVVMRLIYTKGRNMEPLLVRFETDLSGAGVRSVLDNSITLTAGTITVSDEEGRLCVHALDRSLAEGIERSPFAEKLKRLEG